jgi:type I restriction enzyme S subunit
MMSEMFWKRAIEISVGSLSPTINWKALAKQEFLLPPKDQQAQLAELLWAMDEVIEKELSLEKSAENFRDSTFQSFIQGLRLKTLVPIEKLLLAGPTNGFSPKSNSQGNGTQTVSIGAIKAGVFDPTDNLKYATIDPAVVSKYSIEQGDVFVVRGNGNKNLCGKAGIADRAYPKMFYPDLLIRLRFDAQQILPRFAAYQWNHPIAHSRLLRSAKSTNGIWKINGKDVKRHSIAVPDLPRQKAIMTKMNQLNSSLSLMDKKGDSSKALQKSLINQIFSTSAEVAVDK